MLTAFRRILVPLLVAWATACPATSLRASEADDQYAVAAGHYDRGRWKLAVEEFQVFVKKYPTDRRADESAFFLGEALLQLGKFDESRRQFQSYTSRAPEGKFARAAWFRSAEAAYLAGDFDHAKPELDRFLAKYPGDRLNAFTLFYLGDIALGKNDAMAAVGYFRDGLSRFPEGHLQDDCRLGLARALEQQNQTDEAQGLYLAVAGKPGSSLADAAQYHLGALHYNAGRYDQAIASFSAFDGRFAASLWQPNARLGHGLALLKLDRPAEAIAQFDAVLAAKSAGEQLSQQAARGKIQAALAMKDYTAVESQAAQFEQRFPKSTITGDVQRMLARSLVERQHQSQQHGDALLAAARLQDKLKQPQQAAALYQQLATEHPQFSKLDAAIYDWAWALRELGKNDEADRLFQRLRKEYPQSRFRDNATCQLAQRALEAKDYPKAAALLDEVVAAKADAQVREYALCLRGQIAVAEADWPKASEVSEITLREFPQSRRRLFAEFCIAEADYHRPDYKAAGARLERLAGQIKDKREPWMAMIPLRRAQVLAQQEKWTDAYAIAATIEKDYPHFQQQYEVDYLLGRCLANQADFEAARQAYYKVIRSAAGAPTETAARAQWMIGETYFHQKAYRSALREYLSLETLYAFPEWQAAALLEAGKCHQRLGEATQAAELYRQILKDYAKTAVAKQAAEQLSAIEKKSP